jgi:radical SAM protein with 4Fe4S-binding SPASM domain
MKLETFKHTLVVCSKMRIQDVWLHNWGEPLLHPQLNRFVALAALNFKVGFTTNGTLLTIPALKTLKKEGLTYLNLSMNKSTPEEFSSHLHELYVSANSLGIDCYFRTVVDSKEDFKYWNDLLYPYKVYYQRCMINDVKKIRTEDCHAVDKLFFIYFDGTVVPCCRVADEEIIYGNILDKDIIRKIKIGIKKIHTQLKQNKSSVICQHCFEVDDDMPVDFKLSKKIPA